MKTNVNTIRPGQFGEPASEWRSPAATSGGRRGLDAIAFGGGVRVVGGGMSGKGVGVNAGDLPGQEAARRPAEVRAAIVAQASRGKTRAGTTGTAERSRVTAGGAKGGRKVERQRP